MNVCLSVSRPRELRSATASSTFSMWAPISCDTHKFSLRAKSHTSTDGYRSNSRSVSSCSSELKYSLRRRLTSDSHCDASWQTGAPVAYTARIPASRSASTAALEWSGVRALWELSMIVVIPASRATRDVARLPT